MWICQFPVLDAAFFQFLTFSASAMKTANLSGWDRIAVAAVKEISPGRPSQNWIFGRDFCGNKSWIS